MWCAILLYCQYSIHTVYIKFTMYILHPFCPVYLSYLIWSKTHEPHRSSHRATEKYHFILTLNIFVLSTKTKHTIDHNVYCLFLDLRWLFLVMEKRSLTKIFHHRNEHCWRDICPQHDTLKGHPVGLERTLPGIPIQGSSLNRKWNEDCPLGLLSQITTLYFHGSS